MSDDIKHEDDHHYSNDLADWRGCSAVALAKKSDEYILEVPKRTVREFKIPLYAANQGIDDAHADDSNGERLSIDELIKGSIEQYRITGGFADAYTNAYRRTRRQLTRK